MVDRRAQSLVAAALAVTAGISLRSAATAPAPSAHAGPSTTVPVIPSGWRIVAIPLAGPVPGVAPGSTVDLVARSEVLVDAAVVTAVADGAVSVAVPAGSAPAVAEAASLDGVWLVLRPT